MGVGSRDRSRLGANIFGRPRGLPQLGENPGAADGSQNSKGALKNSDDFENRE
jgi:hypothetical protein